MLTFKNVELFAMAVAALLFAGVSEGRADLMEITPPGPGGPRNWSQAVFFDEAAHGTFNTPQGAEYFNGWVSRYGLIDSGQYFFTNVFSSDATNNAMIWWDFTGSSYWLTYVTMWGLGPNGQNQEKTYAVHRRDRHTAPAQQLSLAGGYQIQSIAFYGTNTLPEPRTLLLVGMGLTALAVAGKRKNSPPNDI